MANALLDAALEYAGMGIPVFPVYGVVNGLCTCAAGSKCSSPGKHPLTANGFKNATTDPAQIKDWWRLRPNANIGGVMGQVSGLVVVDIDPRHKGDVNIAAYEVDREDTWIVRTGSLGWHLYYRCTDGAPKGIVTEGVDFQGEGSYVIMPPSLHVEGNQYTWVSRDGEPAELPERLRPVKQKTSSDGTVIQPTLILPQLLAMEVPDGQRNNTLIKIVGHLRNTQSDVETAIQMALNWNAAKCRPPLPDAEVAKTVRESFKRWEGPKHESDRTTWRSDEIALEEFPPIDWIVKDMFAPGMAFLAGGPKTGKSRLLLQLAHDIATGGCTVGFDIFQHWVHYYALEDSPRRINQRMREMGLSGHPNLTVDFELSQATKGGMVELLQKMASGPKLIIVDTLTRFLGGAIDQNKSNEVIDVVDQLQKSALHREICLLLIDHHRKPGVNAEHLLNDIQGSIAKVGTADTILGLYRKPGETNGKLGITGRDVDEQYWSLTWDDLKKSWCVAGSLADVAKADRRKHILGFAFVAEEIDVQMVAKQMDCHWQTAKGELDQLVTDGFLLGRWEKGSGRAGGKMVYRLTPAGKEYAMSGTSEKLKNRLGAQ